MIDDNTVMELEQNLPIHKGDVHCIAVSKEIIATTSGSSVRTCHFNNRFCLFVFLLYFMSCRSKTDAL